jgi:hypothetical protein
MPFPRKEPEMTLLEQIQKQLKQLPPEKQSEVLDFVNFLQQRASTTPTRTRQRSLQHHPAFGAWQARHIDALQYEQTLRAEWDQHP